MPRITAAEFSRLASVSKVAVSKAIKAGRLILADGKLDTDNPVNATYMATDHGGGGRGPSPKKSPPKKPAPEDAAFQKAVRVRQVKKASRAQVAKTDQGDDDLSPAEKAEREKLAKTIADLMGDTADLDRQKKVADIALKKSMEARHTFKLATDKKNVISREEFRRVAEGWNTQLAQTVMRVPRRVVSRLWAMAKAGDDARAGEAYLEKALSAAVTRALEGVAKVAK